MKKNLQIKLCYRAYILAVVQYSQFKSVINFFKLFLFCGQIVALLPILRKQHVLLLSVLEQLKSVTKLPHCLLKKIGPGQKSCTYTSQSNHEFMCVSEDSGVKSIRLNRLAETGTRVHSLITKLLFNSQKLQPNP